MVHVNVARNNNIHANGEPDRRAVAFPNYLSLPVESGLYSTYEACNVVEYRGHSVNHGHYVCYVKEHDKRWMRYDDDQPPVHITNFETH